jgi:hypothetical protein
LRLASLAAGATVLLGAGSAQAAVEPTLRFAAADAPGQTSSNWAGYAVTSGDPAAGAPPTTFSSDGLSFSVAWQVQTPADQAPPPADQVPQP